MVPQTPELLATVYTIKFMFNSPDANMESGIEWNIVLPSDGQEKQLEANKEEGWSATVE